MTAVTELGTELVAVGQAIGLVDSSENLDPSWFEHPLQRVEGVVANPTQRAALLSLLDQLLPPSGDGAAPQGEKWHPLLPASLRGNLFLTVKANGAGPVILGIAGAITGPHGAAAADISGTLSAHLPLLEANGTTLSAVAGTSDGPLDLEVRVALHLHRPASPIGLEAVRVAAVIQPLASAGPNATLRITLEQLDLGDGNPASDVVLDLAETPGQIGAEAVHVIIGLLRAELERAAADGTLSAAVHALATNIAPLLGLDSVAAPGIPPFPFTAVLNNPAALRGWLLSLVQGGGTAAGEWLGHLCGIVGGPATAATGSGTVDDPWRVRLITLPGAAAGGVDVTLAQRTDPRTAVVSLLPGVAVVLAPSAAGSAAAIAAEAVIASIPLSGTAPAAVLPSATVHLAAPGPGGAWLIGNASSTTFAVRELSGGMLWNGTSVQPKLELLDVIFEGAHHAVIDLSNADSVAQAGSALVADAIAAALGTGVGRHLLALVGLADPASAAGWPAGSRANVAALAANPPREIARVHRTVLLDHTNTWAAMLSELATVIGVPGVTPAAVVGTGSEADPWQVPVVTSGSLSVALAAWNAQTDPSPGAVQQLRIGLRLGADKSPWHAGWLAEIVAFDLPQAGAVTARLLSGQHIIASGTPLPPAAAFAGITVGADGFRLALDWTLGSRASCSATVTNVTVSGAGVNITVPAISFPSAAGSPTNPLAALGVDAAHAEDLLRAMVARAAAAWGGTPAHVITALLGVHAGLDGLPADWPLLTDPDVTAGSLFEHPVVAWRAWLGKVLTGLSADGTPFAMHWLRWLQSLLGGILPPVPGAALSSLAPAVTGSGTYDDPWAVLLNPGAAQPVEALLWLDPAGLPVAWADSLVGAITAAPDTTALMNGTAQLGAFVAAADGALAVRSPSSLADGLDGLAAHLAGGDGVVPFASQAPAAAGWTAAATVLHSAHHRLPHDPDAISQILDQIDAWSPGATLVIGPAFGSHADWSDLLIAAEARHAGSTHPNTLFDFRVPGVEPAGVDLRTVTQVSSWYSADLRDDGGADPTPLVTQIGRVVDRIRELTGNATVALVAHSTAGVAARAYAAAAPAATVAGLIALGSPLLGAPLLPLTNATTADALRALRRLLPSGVGDAHLDAALDHLVSAADGYLPGAAGTPAQAAPYPVGSFTGAAATALNGVPGYAITSLLQGDLIAAVRSAVAALATAAGGAATPAPTHLGIGVRTALALPGSGADPVDIDATVRIDAARFRLVSSAPEPPRPAHRVTVRSRITNPGGWIVGAASSFNGVAQPLIDVRVRWAELGAVIESDGTTAHVTPDIRLHDASLHGLAADLVQSTDSTMSALLGAVLEAATTPTLIGGGRLATVLAALQALGIAVPDAHGGIGISADGLTALLADPLGYLVPRLRTALDAGALPGLTGPAGGPWTMAVPGMPADVSVAARPWTLGLRTRVGGINLGGPALSLDAGITLPQLVPRLDAGLHSGPINVTASLPAGALSIDAPPWVSHLQLLPTGSGTAQPAALQELAPRILLSSALSALLKLATGPEFDIGPIDALLADAGAWLSGSGAVGAGGGGGGTPPPGFDAAKITTILNGIASGAGLPTGPGIVLPAGISVGVSGSDPLHIAVLTTTPLLGALGLGLSLDIDHLRHVTPGGTASLHMALDGGATWPGVTITAGVSAGGLSLAVTPDGGGTITLLPTFSGLGAFAQAGAALLPKVLDEIVDNLGPNPVTRGALMRVVLGVADALGIYDDTGHFTAHEAAIAAMLQPSWINTAAATVGSAVASAVAQLVNDVASPLHALPGHVAASGRAVTWSWTPPAASGTVSATLGWDSSGPTLSVAADALALASGALLVHLHAGYAGAALQADASLGVNIGDALGFTFEPVVDVALNGGAFSMRVLPLGVANASVLSVNIAPTPGVHADSGGLATLAEKWLLPLTAKLVLDASQAEMSHSLWTGGPSLATLLTTANVITSTGAGGFTLVTPVADIPTLVVASIEAILTGAPDIPLTSTLKLALVNDGGRLGVRVHGHEEFTAGSMSVGILFGEPADWITDSDHGVTVYLLTAGGGLGSFNPRIHVVGFGLSLSGVDDAPLINTTGFRLGGVDAYAFFDVTFIGGVHVPSSGAGVFGAGVELDKVGLPINLAGQGGGNPVASNLLSGGGGTGGDAQPPNPSIGVVAYYRDGNFHVAFEKQTGALWIGVHRSFGPIYIDQIGVEFVPAPGVDLLIDGGVKVAGLDVQVDELGLTVPFRSILSPGDWSLDLKGLAVGYNNGALSIAGGLLKNDTGQFVEYDGMLSVDIAGRGITAIGSYARPNDAQGSYTSLFLFVSLPIPLGGPPFLFVMGLGGGAGYNRELHVPDDLNQIPNFLLVEAIDDDSLANDPMSALIQMGHAIPPKRGALWFAAGLRFTTFVLISTTAVVTVAVDSGVEVNILGVSRMVLPADDAAIISIELALKARFSSAEGLFSIQAQLTPNSWLLLDACQLTGGFAFFMWFPKAQFVLTLGGYHPAFQKPDNFPDVPRLGFHLYEGVLVLKGELYFALTNTCIMFGGRFEAAYDIDIARAWFIAYADVLISWDPFYYKADIGVSVGAEFSLHICFIGCVDIDISVSLGASLNLAGPPMHGDLTVDLAVASITITVGSDAQTVPYITDWGVFAAKYLTAGDPNATSVSVHAGRGLLPVDPPGATPAPGTQAQPWLMAPEFSFTSETRLPAAQWIDFVNSGPNFADGVNPLDVAPMHKTNVGATHAIDLFADDGSVPTISADHWAITAMVGLVPEATWHWIDPEHVPAAARTIKAITGLSIVGIAVTVDQSALIPIATLVDDSILYARPLPFDAGGAYTGSFKAHGVAAEQLLALAQGASTSVLRAAAFRLLSGGIVSAADRGGLGLKGFPAPPLALRALNFARSAPPVLTPLSTGLSMEPVGLPAAPVVEPRPAVTSVLLDQPRLRSILVGRPQPVAATLPATATSVTALAGVEQLPRMAPPSPAVVAGAALQFVRAATAPRPTTLAGAPRIMRTRELGWSVSAQHGGALDAAAQQLTGDGVAVAAGTSHVWDLPARLAGAAELHVSGAGVARITALTRAGEVLLDTECVGAKVPIPAGTAMVVARCIGTPPAAAGAVAPTREGPGSYSSSYAPAGAIPATGWQTGNVVEQVSATSLLCRGGSITIPVAHVPRPGGQATTQAEVRLAAAVVDATGVQTHLPLSTSVVMLLLDEQDPTAADQGDLAISVDNGTLSDTPVRVGGGRRLALLYDVIARRAGATALIIAAASAAGFRVAGVVGLQGRAVEWAARMAGSAPEQVVPDGPLTPDGEILVRLVAAPVATAAETQLLGVRAQPASAGAAAQPWPADTSGGAP